VENRRYLPFWAGEFCEDFPEELGFGLGTQIKQREGDAEVFVFDGNFPLTYPNLEPAVWAGRTPCPVRPYFFMAVGTNDNYLHVLPPLVLAGVLC